MLGICEHETYERFRVAEPMLSRWGHFARRLPNLGKTPWLFQAVAEHVIRRPPVHGVTSGTLFSYTYEQLLATAGN